MSMYGPLEKCTQRGQRLSIAKDASDLNVSDVRRIHGKLNT